MQASRAKSKSSLFLLELLIMIGFFAVASVVCINLFVQAHLRSIGSRDLNRAVIAAQSAAETFKAAGGDSRRAAEILGGFLGGSDEVVLYYDSRWQPAAAIEERGYTLRMFTSFDGDLMIADIEVVNVRSGQEIFSLQAKRHIMTVDS